MLKQNLTREILKEKIGEENIFTHYFGNWKFNEAYNSIFRDDKKASTGFFLNKHGSIIYNDFATDEKYDFVHFVMKLYGINYYAALQQIAAHFGLVNGKLTGNTGAKINPIIRPKMALKKAIIVNTVLFKKEHLNYWLQFGILKHELQKANIYAVDNFTINKFDENNNVVSSFTSPKNNELKFAYTFAVDDDTTYIKIYTPYSKEYKWVGNVPMNVCFGLADLQPKGDKLIITKSVKDCLVLRKFFPNVIGLQNESFSAISQQVLDLSNAYNNIVFFGDNDRRGLEFCEEVKTLNWESIHFPAKFIEKFNVKDCSDFVKYFNTNTLEQYLKHIKLL